MYCETSARVKRKCGFDTRWLTFESAPVTRLSRQRTFHPFASSRSHKCEPRKPAPPVMTALMDTGTLSYATTIDARRTTQLRDSPTSSASKTLSPKTHGLASERLRRSFLAHTTKVSWRRAIRNLRFEISNERRILRGLRRD